MSQFSEIREGNLIVRRMGPDDAAFVQGCRNHPEVSRYQSWRPPTVEEVVQLAHEQAERAPGMQVEPCQMVIELEDDQGEKHLVGDMGAGAFDPGKQMDIGIVIHPAWQGRGFATRACRMLFSHLFESGLNRVTARVDPRNEASLKLFDRLKFRKEGLERSCWWDEVWNEWTDEVCFAILAEEWPDTLK